MLNRRSVAKGAFALPLFYIHARQALARGADLPDYDDDCGVASGSPTPDGVVLWTRVPAWARSGSTSLSVSYEVSLSPTFAAQSIVARGELGTNAARDFTVKAAVKGLEPFTTYYYRFTTTSGWISAAGRTKTTPAPGTQPASLRLAVVSCQQFSAGHYSAYASLIKEEPDFCLHLGDHIYEHEGGRGSGDEPLGGAEAHTIDDYRKKYRYYLSDPLLREARRLYAWIDLWDDHEVFNDYSGASDLVKDPARFAGAYQAFLEYMPLSPELILQAGATPSVELYRTHALGDLVELFVLDERQYRAPNPCGSTYYTKGCDAMRASDHSMLGQPQKAWLKDGLGSSRATWKLLANEVMMAPLNISIFEENAERTAATFFAGSSERIGDRFLSMDQWDGFPTEREELLGFVEDRHIDNVVVLTGDVHAAFDAYLYRDAAATSGKAAAVEIVTTSITSKTLGEWASVLGSGAQSLLMRSNKHLAWSDITSHGYTMLDITPETLKARHVTVDSIASPTAGSRLARTTIVPNGKAELR